MTIVISMILLLLAPAFVYSKSFDCTKGYPFSSEGAQCVPNAKPTLPLVQNTAVHIHFFGTPVIQLIPGDGTQDNDSSNDGLHRYLIYSHVFYY